jgi:lipopolysaccharide transport protein LptA
MENFIAKLKFLFSIPIMILSFSLLGQENINITAERSALDTESNSAYFESLVIRQDAIIIKALLAQVDNLDFEKNIWTFSGELQLTNDVFNLLANNGQIEFNNYAITSAVFNGTPAIFSAKPINRDIINGQANKIEFNQIDNLLRFLGAAEISIDNTSFKGCDLIYDLVNQRVTAGYSECGENIQITIDVNETP